MKKSAATKSKSPIKPACITSIVQFAHDEKNVPTTIGLDDDGQLHLGTRPREGYQAWVPISPIAAAALFAGLRCIVAPRVLDREKFDQHIRKFLAPEATLVLNPVERAAIQLCAARHDGGDAGRYLRESILSHVGADLRDLKIAV